ncbi:DUF2934 domain-containing protein [Candidatus Competibacter phosphatis]|uniref:DUF2934 domain-containing protein n=1 Tax=Candidatus Competibacter phosphatis TaxID=221280 RepID=A0ABX1TJU4_9GAMM|nr:DUF2934 domain-containing protein [Candidatus Competibacter phosphatis]NMQ18246.1 DUF2934 domain-containing protein [Candidatus Competibacter phosphatis]
MENDLEQEIHNLAYHIWQSAGNEVGRALDFWLMAERMVIELAADSARLANTTATSAWEATTNWPSALRSLYFYRIRDLARQMWLASNERQERSLDYWLAAEKHLRLLMHSTLRAAGASIGKEEALAKTFEAFSPADYLEQIRKTAYQLWEAAGRQYGSALDFWLAAEEKTLESAGASATTATANSANPPVQASPAPTKSRRRSSKQK